MRRYTDAEHGFGDIMPEATVHIRPLRNGDTPFIIQNFDYLAGQDGTSTRVVGVTGTTTESTAITATYITVPASSAVFIDALVTAFCTAGAAAGSAGSYRVQALASSGGSAVTVTTTPFTAKSMSQEQWVPTVVAGTGKVALTVTGSAKCSIKWAYEVTSVALYE